MNNNQIIGLIDFDGTLCNTDPIYDKCIDLIFKKHKISLENRINYKDEVEKRYGFVTGQPWCDILFYTIQYLTGQKMNESYISNLYHEFVDLVVDNSLDAKDLFYYSSCELCRSLFDAGIKLCLHSGTSKKIINSFLNIGSLETIFSSIVCSEDINPDTSLGIGAYKIPLFTHLVDSSQGKKFFVFGDAIGDCFAAKELNIPFILASSETKEPYFEINSKRIYPNYVVNISKKGDSLKKQIDYVLSL